MKKTSKFILMLISALILSNCSNDDSDSVCGTILEPVGNEFTYNCSNYVTEKGRLNIKSTVWLDGTTSCMIELINDPHDFSITAGNSGINHVKIWLIVPVSAYYNGEIPSGTYNLKKLNSSTNEQYVPMDIADFNTVAFNNYPTQSDTGNVFFDTANLIGSEFDEITVEVSKTNDVYTINYFMKKGDKQIKGKFIGVMPIVDIWG